MKAAVVEQYGPPEVLALKDVPKPSPKANEVLIRIRATTVTATDCLIRRGEPTWSRIILGPKRPRNPILGIEMAGEVEAIGGSVRRFQPGDAVFSATMVQMAGCAEYICLPEKAGLARKPANLSYEQAAAVPDGALTPDLPARHRQNQAGAESAHQRRFRLGGVVCGATGQALRGRSDWSVQHGQRRDGQISRRGAGD
jgi:NADPH:quinone reductase-like Zn-dependent oxidoreductase